MSVSNNKATFRRHIRRNCIAKCCPYSNITKPPDLTFFKLPKEEKRRREWLTILERKDLLELDDYKSYSVCAAHFEDWSIRVANHLTDGAVPLNVHARGREDASTSKQQSQVTTEQTQHVTDTARVSNETVEIQAVTSKRFHVSVQTSEELDLEYPKRRRLQQDSTCEELKLEPIIVKTESLKNSALDTENVAVLNSHTELKNYNISLVSKKFQYLIDWRNQFKSPYETEFKEFALNLLFSSPESYRRLQPVLKLPSKSTLHKFKFKLAPKLDDRLLKCLSLKVKALPKLANYCSLCINQINLKRNLCYDAKTDEIIGLHSIDGIVSPELASHAYVMILQGIYVRWDQPLTYAFFTNTKRYYKLDMWIAEVIAKLYDNGVDVRAIITDHESNFDIFAIERGKITTECPFFYVDGRKIFHIFDFPHLLNSFRDHWLSGDFYTNEELIKWDYIKKIYEDQKNLNIKLIPKLTKAHIAPNRVQKKKLKYVTPIFSSSMAAALEINIKLGKLPAKAKDTEYFVRTVSELFEMLNTGDAFTMSEYQRAFSSQALSVFASIKAEGRTERSSTRQLEMIAEYFQASIQAQIQMLAEMRKNGHSYLLTSRLNQDVFRNMCDAVRRQAKCNKPTPVEFMRIFSRMLLLKLIDQPASKADLSLDKMLQKTEQVIKLVEMRDKRQYERSLVLLPSETDFRMELPVVNASIYVAGYLMYKCSIAHNCPVFESKLETLEDLNQSPLYVHYKRVNKNALFYERLKMPPKEITEYLDRLEAKLVRYFVKCTQNMSQIGSAMYEILKEERVEKLCPCFPLEYFLKLYIRLRIFVSLQHHNRASKKTRKKSTSYMVFKVKHLNDQRSSSCKNNLLLNTKTVKR